MPLASHQIYTLFAPYLESDVLDNVIGQDANLNIEQEIEYIRLICDFLTAQPNVKHETYDTLRHAINLTDDSAAEALDYVYITPRDTILQGQQLPASDMPRINYLADCGLFFIVQKRLSELEVMQQFDATINAIITRLEERRAELQTQPQVMPIPLLTELYASAHGPVNAFLDRLSQREGAERIAQWVRVSAEKDYERTRFTNYCQSSTNLLPLSVALVSSLYSYVAVNSDELDNGQAQWALIITAVACISAFKTVNQLRQNFKHHDRALNSMHRIDNGELSQNIQQLAQVGKGIFNAIGDLPQVNAPEVPAARDLRP